MSCPRAAKATRVATGVETGVPNQLMQRLGRNPGTAGTSSDTSSSRAEQRPIRPGVHNLRSFEAGLANMIRAAGQTGSSLALLVAKIADHAEPGRHIGPGFLRRIERDLEPG